MASQLSNHLTMIQSHSKVEKVSLDSFFSSSTLQGCNGPAFFLERDMKNQTTMDGILKYILELYQADSDLFFSKRKFTEISHMRWHFMKLCKDSGFSTSSISSYTGYDRSSIGYALNKMEDGFDIEECVMGIRIYNEMKKGKSNAKLIAMFPKHEARVRDIAKRLQPSVKKSIVTKKIVMNKEKVCREDFINALTQLKVRMGSMSHLLVSQLSPEVSAFWVNKTVDDGYESISECLADYLTDEYFAQTGGNYEQE